MGGYIGAKSGVGLVNTTLGSVQDLTATDASPEVTLINSTHEDTDGGREGKVIFKGQQSGGEESTLAEIQASHDGTADDEKGDLIFRTNDGSDGASPTEAMRITSQQRVGILTNDPSHALDVTQSGATSVRVGGTGGSGANDGTLIINNGGTGDAMLRFDYETNTDRARIGTSTSGQQLEFYTAGDNERMRIDSNGDVLFNTTTNTGGTITTAASGLNTANSPLETKSTTTGSGTVYAATFFNGSTASGHILVNGAATTYATSSDYRLKENVTDITDGITRVKQLEPKRFNWIADESNTTMDGFIAHEAQTVVPEAVSGKKDAVEVWVEGEELPDGVSIGDNKLDDDGNTIPTMQGIDQSKMVPLLTAALQEAIAKIETLETKVAALEAE